MQDASFDDLRIVGYVYYQRRVQLNHKSILAALSVFKLLTRYAQRARGDELVNQIVKLVQLESYTAVRHEVANVSRFESLMNEDTVTHRYLYFAERVARIVSL